VSVERETFPALAADGTLYASASDSYWLDTGTPAAYLRAHADLLDGTRAGLPAPGASPLGDGAWSLGEPRVAGTVERASLVGDQAEVAAGALMRGSVLGAGAVLGRGALLVGSVVLPGATVGEGAAVTGSVVGPGAVIGAGCIVEPLSVLGDGAALEAGAKVADVRIPAEAA
jgi:mannose-1-phosphate guanylyltransferase